MNTFLQIVESLNRWIVGSWSHRARLRFDSTGQRFNVLTILFFLGGGFSAVGQTPLSNIVFTAGTTIRDNANHDWSYVLLNASSPSLLAGKRFAVYGKPGYPTNAGTFTLRGTIFQQTSTAAINTLLNQSIVLGENPTNLNHTLTNLLHNVPGIASQTLPQVILTAFQTAGDDPTIAEVLGLMAGGHPALHLCAGHAFSEQITTNTTYELREINPATGAAGDVVGRVTIVPNVPVILPAPGRPFQVMTNEPGDNLRIRLRWGTPDILRRLSLLNFGFNVWRIPRAAAEAGNFQTTPPTPAQLLGNPNFTRANPVGAIMANKDFSAGSGAGAADDPADRTTYFFADNGHATGTNFSDGQQFYYFITARDLLGRDGLASPGGLTRACRRLPPAQPGGVQVENAVLPGSTNQPRLKVVWEQNTNATDAVSEYWVYRWVNPTLMLSNDAAPLNNRIAVVPSLPGTNSNSYLDTSPGALTNSNPTNLWYSVRAVSQAACDPLLSPQAGPAWGVLRERSAPEATTGSVVGSCGTPVVKFQNFATNPVPADPQTWNFRFTCVRRDRGIAWVMFTVTNTPSFGNVQVDTIGPVYFSPTDDTAPVDYPVSAADDLSHTIDVGCVVGTYYGQVSAAAQCTFTTLPTPTQQREAVFFAGQLLTTALSSSDPLLAVLNSGNTGCFSALNPKADASGMVSMQFLFAPPGKPLLVQALSSNTWSDIEVVTPDANNVYWVSYPACLVGPLPSFQGCLVNLPNDPGCDHHVARAADNGPVAPLRIRFKLTQRTREYRVYRRADDGPLTLFAQGAAIYDPANSNKLIEAKDEAMPSSKARLCYFVQTLDENGNGSPLAFIGCMDTLPTPLPRPVLSEPQAAGDINNPQVTLNWFCPTSGVSRFLFKIKRVDPPAPGAATGFSILKAQIYIPYNKAISYLGLLKQNSALAAADEAQLTTPIGPGFGPGPQFTLGASVVANGTYDIFVSAVDDLGNPGPNSEVWRFTWTPPVVLQNVPWPARPLPPTRDFDVYAPGETPPSYAPRVMARVFYDSDGVAPNPRYPVGIRIGQLDISGQPNPNAITDHTDEYLNYFGGTHSNPDPNTGVFRSHGSSRIGQSLLPIVLYRQQLTNSFFPRVSGDLTQVSPLIERVPWTINANQQVTIPDRLFAGNYESYDDHTVYFFYLRDLQPVQLGAKYRYFAVRFNDKREVQDIIPAGDVELPLPTP